MKTFVPVHTVTAGEGGLLYNSYIVEGERRIVAIDPPMLRSDARVLAERIARLEKPLGAIIITHAHPDHANGAVELADVPLVALDATARVLAETAEPKRAQWTPVYGDDYPQVIRLPSVAIASGEVFAVDELTFRVTDLGAGECASMALWTLERPERVVFAGDFVYPGVHGWLAEGRTGAWLAQLDTLAGLLRPDDVLYPGHGDRSTVAALAEQRDYLTFFRATVERFGGGAAVLDAPAAARIDAAIRAQYPSYRLPSLIELGANGVAAELAGGVP